MNTTNSIKTMVNIINYEEEVQNCRTQEVYWEKTIL
jgi:hypothetical protein